MKKLLFVTREKLQDIIPCDLFPDEYEIVMTSDYLVDCNDHSSAVIICSREMTFFESQVKLIREKNKAVPIIIISGNRDIIRRVKYKVVTNDIIILPAESDMIFRRIRMAIDEAPLMYLRYYQYADILRMSKDRDAAYTAYETCLELNVEFLPAYVDLGYYCYRGKDYLRAKKVVETALEHFPDEPELLRLKARIALKEHDYDKAERSYRRCVRYAPFSVVLIIELFFLLVRRKKSAQAFRSVRRGFSQLIEMKEKMRHYLHIAQKYAGDREVLFDCRFALRYFPEDEEFQRIYAEYSGKTECGS